MATNFHLSAEDVSRLLEDKSPHVRVEVFEKVAGTYNDKQFSEQQIKLAEQIFRTLMQDAEVMVRQALAENFKHNPDVPHDIILSLAKDVDQVALPVLQFSSVLTDDDLVDIIQTSNSTERLLAISNRETVSEKVSDALVETENSQVVSHLLNKASVKFSEIGLSRVFDIFSEDKEITGRLAQRESLPVALTEKMVMLAADNIRELVLGKYEKKYPHLKTVFEKSKESATLKFLGLTSQDDIRKLVDEMEKSSDISQNIRAASENVSHIIEKLEDEGRLSPISALCMGHLRLFEISLARVTKVPVFNVRKLLSDDSGEGFNALYKKAEFPIHIHDAVWMVVRVLREMDHETPGKRQPAKEIISRLLLKAEAEKKGVENLSYFISMIHQHSKLSNAS